MEKKISLGGIERKQKKNSHFRVIYWTDWGAHPKIEKSNYDGSNRQTLIDSGLKFPNGLVYDGTSKYSLPSVKKKTVKTIRYTFLKLYIRVLNIIFSKQALPVRCWDQ